MIDAQGVLPAAGHVEVHMGQQVAEDREPVGHACLALGVRQRHVQRCGGALLACATESLNQLCAAVAEQPPGCRQHANGAPVARAKQIGRAEAPLSATVLAGLAVCSNASAFRTEDDVPLLLPEVTLEVSDREVPGIGQVVRGESLKITSRAMLSRGTAGQRGRTLIINLPGSEKAVRESFGFVEGVVEHAVEMMAGGGHG